MTTTEGSPTVRLHDSPLRCSRGRWLVQGVFFAGIWVYLWFVIKPRLIYDAFGIYLPYPEFSLDGACFREAWSRVAGPLEYVCAFLSQWFSVAPLGALMVTAVTALICLGTSRLIRDMGATHGWFLSLVPAPAVLVLYRTYHHPLDALLALAICLWLAAAYQGMVVPGRAGGLAYVGRPFQAVMTAWKGRPTWLPVVFLAMCLGIYCLAGTVCVLFGLLVGTWYACAKRRVVAGAGAVVASALAPWLAGTKLYYMTVMEAYCVVWPFGPGSTSDMETLPLMILRGLFVFPLGVLWLVALSRVLPGALHDRFARFSRCAGPNLRVMAELVLLAAAVAAVHLFLRAPHRERRFEMVHFALERQWDKVLRAARQLPGSGHDCFSRHLVNRALYHTGRMGDDLFSFSQDQAGLLLLSGNVPHGAPKFWMLSEIALELGDVNLAEQWAFERLEAVGESPSALELLALVCLAKDQATLVGRPFEAAATASKGRPTDISFSSGREAARVLLSRMAKNVIHGRRAETLLGLLDGQPPAGGEWQLDRVRALRCSDDRVFQTYSEDLMLEGLLRANPRNKMAFEYLMAFYLVSRRADQLVQNLHRLNDFGYREIPRHYEEAILIHANETSQPVALHGRKIRPETIQRFQRFVERFRPWLKQPQLAAGALADEFGDSYFYYYAFGVSGAGGARSSPNSQDSLAGDSGRGMPGTGEMR